MTSVITPLDDDLEPHSLKLTCGIQEWSGQSFLALQWKGHRYEIMDHGYADMPEKQTKSLVNTWLEDELLTKIKVSPDDLPIGKIKIVPSLVYLRQNNLSPSVEEAEATLTQSSDQYTYSLLYKMNERKLEIQFERKFPHRILGWKESVNNTEVRSAIMLKSIQSDYWNHQQPADKMIRDSLGL